MSFKLQYAKLLPHVKKNEGIEASWILIKWFFLFICLFFVEIIIIADCISFVTFVEQYSSQ